MFIKWRTANKRSNISYNRTIVEAARLASKQYALTLRSYSEDWIIVLEKADKRHILCGYALGINNDAASSSANDKVATYCLLSAAGVASVPHHLLSTVIDAGISVGILSELLQQYADVVVKPLRGSRGELVARFQSVRDAQKFIGSSGEREWAASPFIDIQTEIRFVMYRGQIRLAYKKINPVIKQGVKLFNLSQGSEAEALPLQEVPKELSMLAERAMQALQLTLGAVDVVIDAAGTAQVLEINSHFSLDHFALSSVAAKQQVLDFYVMLLAELFGYHS